MSRDGQKAALKAVAMFMVGFNLGAAVMGAFVVSLSKLVISALAVVGMFVAMMIYRDLDERE